MKNPFKGANEDVNDNIENGTNEEIKADDCLLYTSPSPRD